MSKEDVKKVVKNIQTQSQPILSSALVTGATRISNEMNHAVSGLDQSPAILLGKIVTSLMSGAKAAGQEMMTSGMESIKKNQK